MRLNTLYLMIITSAVSGCAMISSGPAPVHAPAPAPMAKPLPSTDNTPQAPSRHAEALLQALLALGVDYQYGGQSPTTGFDCSGLVAHVFQQAYGLRLPRNTRGQSRAGMAVGSEELRAGDLVFFNTLNRPYSHVGIYLGDGRFVHAPRSGAQVRVERLEMAYWARRFDGARRIPV